MVIPYPDAFELACQSVAQTLGIGPFPTEDDCRLLAEPCNFYHPLYPVERAVCAVDYVGPVGIGLDYKRAGEEQTGSDVSDGLFGGGGGECQDLVGPEADDGIGERAVCRTEILAPLGDYMGFVHHKEADAALCQFTHNKTVLEAFGCGDHDPGSAVQLGEQLASVLVRLAASQADAVDTSLPESGNLIVHQSQKRVDDDRDALAEDCRKQEAQRLPGAGRKNHKLVPDRPAVLLLQDPVDNKNLVGFERGYPESGGCGGQDQGHVISLHISNNR